MHIAVLGRCTQAMYYWLFAKANRHAISSWRSYITITQHRPRNKLFNLNKTSLFIQDPWIDISPKMQLINFNLCGKLRRSLREAQNTKTKSIFTFYTGTSTNQAELAGLLEKSQTTLPKAQHCLRWTDQWQATSNCGLPHWPIVPFVGGTWEWCLFIPCSRCWAHWGTGSTWSWALWWPLWPERPEAALLTTPRWLVRREETWASKHKTVIFHFRPQCHIYCLLSPSD